MKDSSMCSIKYFNLIDSIRYGLMGVLQFHEMGMYGFRALFTHQPRSKSSPHLWNYMIFHNYILGGQCMEKFLSVEPQEDEVWRTTGEFLSYPKYLSSFASSGRGGGVIDFMYWISALWSLSTLVFLYAWLLWDMPSTIWRELLKVWANSIIKNIYDRTFFTVIIKFAKSG